MAKTAIQQGPWSLRELYAGLEAPEIQKEIEALEAEVLAFEAHRAELAPDLAPQAFSGMLTEYDGLLRLLSRLDGFADLSFSQDTQDAKIQAFRARVQQLAAETANRTLFFQLWWKGLEDAAAARLMQASGDFRYWLEALRLQKPYTLSEPEEKVMMLERTSTSNSANSFLFIS